MEKEIFRKRFRELYIVSGCSSITQFAKQLEMKRQSVDRYYNGERCPDAPALTQICERMNVSADWLLGLSDVRNPSVELRAVCEYTGLTEAAIKRITNSDVEWPLPVDALSHLIASSGFSDVVEAYSLFLDLLGRIEYKQTIDTITSYQQRDDGTIEMSIYEAIHHYMNKATMAFNSVCGYEYSQKIDKLDVRDYNTPDELVKMEAVREGLSDLITVPRSPGGSEDGNSSQKTPMSENQPSSKRGRQR